MKPRTLFRDSIVDGLVAAIKKLRPDLDVELRDKKRHREHVARATRERRRRQRAEIA